MKIAVAGDNVGVGLADVLVMHLKNCPGIEVDNLTSTDSNRGECYANIAERMAQEILAGAFDRGILCCGTGIGMAISANKISGIRAAQTHDTFSAERAAKSNNAQIITLGARVVGPELAKAIVNAWINSDFDPKGASAANVEAISEMEARHRK